MNYGTQLGDPAKVQNQCVLVGVYENNQMTPSATAIDQASDGYLKKVLDRGDIKGKAEQQLLLHDVPNVSAARVLVVGLGKQESLDAAKFKLVARAVAGRLKSLQAKQVLCCLAEAAVADKDLAWKLRRMIEQFADGLYKYTDMKGSGRKPDEAKNESQVETIEFLLASDQEAQAAAAAISRGAALVAGLAAAKDLGNTPGNVCHPTYIADKAKQLAKDYPSISTQVLDESKLKELGMGAFLSVSQGSTQPGKMIVMTHKGGKEGAKPHILVGKGITFDSGGISLKPGAGMHEMIFDMCGAASVLGAMTAIGEQKLPLNVIGVIVAAENMPSGNASRPGDIVTSLSGQTIEILNTDAEGRLVLCDALTYIDRFKPETVVDIATLTGACVVALGNHASGLYANDEALAADLLAAGEDSLDRAWRMPLWDEYQKQIDSAFADIANVGGREAGSVTAACFLARFTKKYRWAHLDIAGTAWRGNGPNKGATGRPVSLLVDYLNNLVAA